jgi:dihydroorotate dehydrogenase
LDFPNPLGVAAGFDKDARVTRALGILGFGHIEVGTLTPRPQPGNPRPRVFRLVRDRALINRMGFPNCGVEAVLPRLEKITSRPHRWILGVSLGKQKETPLKGAAADYELLMRAVYPYADYMVVNISSPNTPGLRKLQRARYLRDLLGRLVAVRDEQAHGARKKPLAVKIDPDLDDGELDQMIEIFLATGIDGVIATNTTLRREGLIEPCDEEGGLSGPPLRERSTRIIQRIAQQTAGRLPIIGAGGIETAAHAREKLDAGASLVQIYTGFIYHGPATAFHIVRGL